MVPLLRRLGDGENPTFRGGRSGWLWPDRCRTKGLARLVTHVRPPAPWPQSAPKPDYRKGEGQPGFRLAFTGSDASGYRRFALRKSKSEPERALSSGR